MLCGVVSACGAVRRSKQENANGLGDRLDNSLRDIIELNTFSTLLSKRWQRQLKPGKDVNPLVGVLGLGMRSPQRGSHSRIGRNENPEPADASSEHTLVLTRPGKADAFGLTMGCVRIHGRRYCLSVDFGTADRHQVLDSEKTKSQPTVCHFGIGAL